MTAIMKNQPTLSDHEVLTGLVERITYQNAENGFCVIRIKGPWPPRAGHLGRPCRRDLCGEWVTATGNWVNDLAWAPSMPVSDRTARARAEEAGRPHLFLF